MDDSIPGHAAICFSLIFFGFSTNNVENDVLLFRLEVFQ